MLILRSRCWASEVPARFAKKYDIQRASAQCSRSRREPSTYSGFSPKSTSLPSHKCKGFESGRTASQWHTMAGRVRRDERNCPADSDLRQSTGQATRSVVPRGSSDPKGAIDLHCPADHCLQDCGEAFLMSWQSAQQHLTAGEVGGTEHSTQCAMIVCGLCDASCGLSDVRVAAVSACQGSGTLGRVDMKSSSPCWVYCSLWRERRDYT